MDGLAKLAINDKGFTFDPATGESFRMNDSALVIIRHLRQGLSPEQVASEMSRSFAVSESTALEDILELMMQLRSFGICS